MPSNCTHLHPLIFDQKSFRGMLSVCILLLTITTLVGSQSYQGSYGPQFSGNTVNNQYQQQQSQSAGAYYGPTQYSQNQYSQNQYGQNQPYPQHQYSSRQYPNNNARSEFERESIPIGRITFRLERLVNLPADLNLKPNRRYIYLPADLPLNI